FHVRHNPRPGTTAAAPGSGGSEVGRFHGTGADGAAIGRRVAVVEAATAIVMRPVDDVIDALGLVVDRKIGSIVVAESHARHDEYAIRLVITDGNRRHMGTRLG